MANTLKRKRARIENPRESIANNDPKLHELFDVGSVSHQGDLMFVAIATLPKSARPRTNRQLAEGDTQGSRHVLARGDIYDADRMEISQLILSATATAGHACHVGEQYIGPVFVAPNNPAATDLAHPEHGAVGFPAGTICATVYQRNLDQEEREARVRD